ncbi:HRDC domain-containing protein [Corynebacterium pygosceleis]|uniref:HRDC domain-containing protein n=1 Tax=Corynebacterium pygosceleis TaxID=2800406 RepID=A0A9Q4C901_9CORY|nr:HRDC domain-containing protein [Corynebacterium pygosceleis]MCK7636902.1 HRDC domain-containing protein [Corynebacterium pygosceleis]MCK7674376.1 HRDC domain-containing protein [Corynebacterium pygosceleis]MCL0120326.1 HRDC domain-containing protein [Corynebacterium pygosceleis]MCX7443873.1 HRDC domain-containing protein [Corynebacterium pygosceleis]MCX7467655.1 HRDC domain-containing protein [Corynebacterium pygosceleis]
MAVPLTSPTGGTPVLIDSVRGFSAAASALAAGRGPVAVDTERASGYRYDERAFLIQLRRRDTGTLLLDPEGRHDEIREALAPVLNDMTWVIHAAPSDLPCLGQLGLYPADLFDTELAGRIAGMERVNLAAMVEDVLGYSLSKGHGREDWSTRPLPVDWLNYAALDVELLNELAEAMAEILDAGGKLDWAVQEFHHIRRVHGPRATPAPSTWTGAKGINGLTRPEQRAVARELWMERDRIARQRDCAVHRVLKTRTMIEIARRLPDSSRELATISGFPGRDERARARWMSVVDKARRSPRSSWPTVPRNGAEHVPGRSALSSYPEVKASLSRVRDALTEVSVDVRVPVENILAPATLRSVVWNTVEKGRIRSVGDLIGHLENCGARSWQIGLSLPVLSRELL